MKKFLFWLALIIFLIYLFYLNFNLVLAAALIPSFNAFLLSLLGFFLFAIRLISGYTTVIAFTDLMLKDKEIEREKVEAHITDPMIRLSQYTIFELIKIINKGLEPYSYAYYGLYMITILLSTLANTNLGGNILTGIFLGASIPTFIVWATALWADSKILKLSEKLANFEEKIEINEKVEENSSEDGSDNEESKS